MRVTIAHKKGKTEATRIVNESTEELLRGMATGPVLITEMQRNWTGDVMDFSFKARMGFLSVPIAGRIEVRDTEVTIEADLPGFLTKLLPEEKIRAGIESKAKGLLT